MSLRDIQKTSNEIVTNTKAFDGEYLSINVILQATCCWYHILNQNNKAQNETTIEQYYSLKEKLAILLRLECFNQTVDGIYCVLLVLQDIASMLKPHSTKSNF